MNCTECLQESVELMSTYSGGRICPQCAELYYCNCAGCGELLPQGKAITSDGFEFCAECYARQADKPLSEEELAGLMSEYVRLYAEEKKLSEKLEKIKDRLKRHAATQRRTNNAVMLKSGDLSVKCNFTVRISYDSEKLQVAEVLLGEERFSRLFEREIKFNPVKEQLNAFLSANDNAYRAAREAINSSMKKSEVVSITALKRN